MEERSILNPQIAIQIESTDLKVIPGNSINLRVFLHNQGSTDGLFDLKVGGIPRNWVSLPSPLIPLAAGELREVLLVIQPPPPPLGRAGRYYIVILVSNQDEPQLAAEATCTLTVAELEVPGRIGMLLASTEFPVEPEGSVTIPLVLLNQGLASDVVSLSVRGIPSSWVSTSSPSVVLPPGEQQEVTLTIQPTLSRKNGAGRHPFQILVASPDSPGHVNRADCTLVITDFFFQFNSVLLPERIEGGEMAQVVVENQGSVAQAFLLTWQGPEDGLAFEPGEIQELAIAAGGVAVAEFQATPRSRPLLGGERVLPFTTYVQGAEGPMQKLSGEVVSKPLIPIWLALVALSACVFLSVTAAIMVTSREEGTDETPAPVATDLWQQILASGKIKVATAAGYPPFEYYDENFRLDGFDIALIKAIGQELGVEVEITDFAFDGLADALRIGQADLAIAAIAFTPERALLFDFSNIYLVTESATLAQENAAFAQVKVANDLAGYNIGAQRGTVYQDWVQENLIDAGLADQDNIFIYERIESAVNDLRSGRVDLVLLDAPVAETEVARGGVKVASRGLYQQRLAIGMPLGEEALRQQVNNALRTLQDNNVIQGLALQYLGRNPEDIIPPPEVLPTPVPTRPEPTPVPPGPEATPVPPREEPTPVPPPPACIDGAAWLAELSYDDSQGVPVLDPGQPFRKGWRLRNSGTCTWDSGYSLRYVRGNTPASQMSGQPIVVQGTVAPGQSYDFWVDLLAPGTPDEYQGFWVMHNGQDRQFGETVWVAIRVPAPPTVAPAPSINFTADRTSIRQGECVTFNWNVTDAQSVYFYAEGQNWQDHGKAGVGSQVECPQVTTIYFLQVVALGSDVITQSIPITVETAANAPLISRFELQPTGQIPMGGCVTITWQVDGDINNVALSSDNLPLWNGAPTSGTYQDCPATSGSVTYGLEASGPSGTSRAQQNINVAAP
jgi:polar amino acid transport system substrate-binding protein